MLDNDRPTMGRLRQQVKQVVALNVHEHARTPEPASQVGACRLRAVATCEGPREPGSGLGSKDVRLDPGCPRHPGGGTVDIGGLGDRHNLDDEPVRQAAEQSRFPDAAAAVLRPRQVMGQIEYPWALGAGAVRIIG